MKVSFFIRKLLFIILSIFNFILFFMIINYIFDKCNVREKYYRVVARNKYVYYFFSSYPVILLTLTGIVNWSSLTLFIKVQSHLQNATHFVGLAYPPNRFQDKSAHSCKHDSHFALKPAWLWTIKKSHELYESIFTKSAGNLPI